MSRNGECIRLEDGGPVIGAFADRLTRSAKIKFYSGDKLLLFTDGVTEARNASGEEFGEQRLQECFASVSRPQCG